MAERYCVESLRAALLQQRGMDHQHGVQGQEPHVAKGEGAVVGSPPAAVYWATTHENAPAWRCEVVNRGEVERQVGQGLPQYIPAVMVPA